MSSFFSCLIISTKSPIDAWSSADVGSSNKSIEGFVISARAIAILCFSPPDKVSG